MMYRIRWLDNDVICDSNEAEGLIETLESEGGAPKVEVLSRGEECPEESLVAAGENSHVDKTL